MEIKFNGVSRKLNACVMTMANKLFPCGYDVGSNAPSSLEELKDHVKKTGRIMVSGEHCETSIFGDKEVNCAFRAWHDFHHLQGNHEFTPEGEYQVCKKQCEDIIKVYGGSVQSQEFIEYIRADILGQGEYFGVYQEFPQDQKAFVLAYVEHGEEAYNTKW